MKYFYLAFTALLCTFASANFADHNISKKERKAVVSFLNKTNKVFLKSVEGLSEAQLDYKSSPEKWSIRECAEHITITESLLLESIKKSVKKQVDTSMHNVISDDEMLVKLTDRTVKFNAPEGIQPKGTFQSFAELITRYKTVRKETSEFAEITQEDLRIHYMKHLAFGYIDCYQWLLVIAGHCERHTLQIKEIKSNPAFPKH